MASKSYLSKNVRPFAVKTMVVMTDGLHNSGGDPVAAAKKAAKKNITINTVTFSTEADFARMKAVAEATGGKHFHAADAAVTRSNLPRNSVDIARYAD